MNKLVKATVYMMAAGVVFGASAWAEDRAAGYIDFGKFTAPAGGGEFVEVNVGGSLIGMVAKLAEKSEPEVAEIIRGVKMIRANVIGLTDENRGEIEGRVHKIRAELDEKGWERVVVAREKSSDVAVYIKTQGEAALEGVVVTVIEGKKHAVLVNVVGDIRPEKLALLGERFNIEPLKELEAKRKSTASAK